MLKYIVIKLNAYFGFIFIDVTTM